MDSSDSLRKGMGAAMAVLLQVLVACGGQRTANEPTSTIASVPVLTWGGQSILGYLKVELRGNDSGVRPSVTELRVYRADGSFVGYTGRMVELPSDLQPTPGVWQVFVHFPDEILREQQILALLTPEGTLRLCLYKAADGRSTCELRPIN